MDQNDIFYRRNFYGHRFSGKKREKKTCNLPQTQKKSSDPTEDGRKENNYLARTQPINRVGPKDESFNLSSHCTAQLGRKLKAYLRSDVGYCVTKLLPTKLPLSRAIDKHHRSKNTMDFFFFFLLLGQPDNFFSICVKKKNRDSHSSFILKFQFEQ